MYLIYVHHSLSLILFRIQKRMKSGHYILETCLRHLPLCWCCSPQPTTQTVHNQIHNKLYLLITGHFLIIFSSVTVMMPAYSVNRAYSIFFVTFSVIGKKLLMSIIAAADSELLCCYTMLNV